MKTKNKVIIILVSTIMVLAAVFAGPILFKQAFIAAKHMRNLSDLEDATNVANSDGLVFVDEGNIKEGLTYFQKALASANQYNAKNSFVDQLLKSNRDILLSDSYNNIGYAYYLLDDYEASKENLEKALGFEPNDAIEYSNMGNTYLGMYKYDEALKNFDLAIEQDIDAKFAYYGKGVAYYDQYDYEKALPMFETYMKYEPEDVDAIKYVIYCNLYLGNKFNALELAENAIKKHNEDMDFYLAKSDIYAEIKTYNLVEAYNISIAKRFKQEVAVQINLGEFYYDHQEFQAALQQFLSTKKRFWNNTEIDSWVITCYSALNDLEGAEEYFQKVENAGNATYQLYNDLGNAFLDSTRYMEAIPFFQKAAALEPETEDAYVNIIYSMYYGERYTKCIEYAKSVEKKFPTTYDIPAFIGDSYYALGEFEKALEAYKQALELSPENADLLSLIGDTYICMQDFVNAEKYANEALAVNPDNVTAQNTITAVQSRQGTISNQVSDFIKTNYLYNEEGSGISQKVDRLFSKDDMSNLDIAMAVDQIRLPEDMFTFTIFDEYYDDYYSDTAKDVEYSDYGDIKYIQIHTFSPKTDSQVIDIIDSIHNPQEAILAIDLRGNGGGLLQAAVNILDDLLGECVTCTYFNGKGYENSYYSDASQIKFKKIYVLVDENSASASELLTLGLKTYLKNVTVLGRNTFGKGVGQMVFEDKDRKLIIFLVNFYWNVRQQNIMGTGIDPDINVKSDKLADYIAIMRQ